MQVGLEVEFEFKDRKFSAYWISRHCDGVTRRELDITTDHPFGNMVDIGEVEDVRALYQCFVSRVQRLSDEPEYHPDKRNLEVRMNYSRATEFSDKYLDKHPHLKRELGI
ncbi:hypothetical protein HY212_05175 [Candidatus Pacearchaeota archaeon]|nr:hypothetical protein [Candidatus Pacearchaeota archaeon]